MSPHLQPPAVSAADSAVSQASTGVAADSAAVSATPPAIRSPRMSHLRQLRLMLEELILKADARDCLQQHGRHRYADRIACERDFQDLLGSLKDYVESTWDESAAERSLPGSSSSRIQRVDVSQQRTDAGRATSGGAGRPRCIQTTVGRISAAPQVADQQWEADDRRQTVRVQLRVSRPLAQILATLHRRDATTGRTVETILWESESIQKLAMSLGLSSRD